MVDVIRQAFLEEPTLPNSPFRMELPMDWVLFDDQPYPEWAIEATTEWTVASPQTTAPLDDLYDEGV